MVSTVRTCLPSSTKPDVHEGEGLLERQEKERNFVEGKCVRIAMSVSRPEADREKTACMDRVPLMELDDVDSVPSSLLNQRSRSRCQKYPHVVQSDDVMITR